MQFVQFVELIKNVRAYEVRVGNGNGMRQLDFTLCLRSLQDLMSEQHAGGLAPNFATTNTAASNLFEIGNGKEILGDANEG